MAPVPPRAADAEGLAGTRERFLTAEPVEPSEVRDTILASWWRSRRWKVAADRIELPYVRDPNLDTPLTRSARPVLQELREQLDGQPISIILTDPAGVVLTRLTADADLERHLDRVQLSPGFSYAEQFVGTNGIGTALEGGRPMHVFGHEHYAEDLEDLACAGVPIHHPVTGKTVGALDLTCWRRDAGPLLVTLARTTASQIRQALLTETGMRELDLFYEYLRVCRRTPGIVFALNNDVAMMNDHARRHLPPGDQELLLGQAAEALAAGHRGPVTLTLPTGTQVRMYCRPVHGEAGPAGGVVHVKLIGAAGGRQPADPGPGSGTPARMLLPGLVGSGALWLRACHEIEEAYESGEWLAVEGERGTGKLAAVRAVHQRRHPAGRFHVVDAADAGRPEWLADLRRELLGQADSLVVRHVDRLEQAKLRALAAGLQEAVSAERRDSLWVVVTLAQAGKGAGVAWLLRHFPRTVTVPPLRHHSEDLRELVPFFLARLSHGSPPTCSPEALQLLMRSSWPGNTGQLYQVLRRVVQVRRTGSIHPNDLPPECRSVSRRLLSPLESMERDAIVHSLLDTDGNKVRAARALGMSRATIYRKIREYGIVPPTG
jgi:sigma-54 dependent transcriptional regulator, acetoin dehydrogenase operon transcriptional activator AcoR